MKYILIDGQNFLYRTAHVENKLEQLTNSKLLPTGYVFKFIQNLFAILKSFDGYHPIIVWDGSKQARRKISNGQYNSDRDKTRAEQKELDKITPPETFTRLNYKTNQLESMTVPNILWKSKDWLKDNLSYIIPCIFDPITETDDIIAEIVLMHPEHEFIIMSNDQDFYQLLDYVEVFNPFSKKMINKEYLTKEYSRWGFDTGYEYLFQKIVGGDGSDSIPSLLSGIGEVAACNWTKFVSETVNIKTPLALSKNVEVVLKKLLEIEKLPRCSAKFDNKELIRENFIMNNKLINLFEYRYLGNTEDIHNQINNALGFKLNQYKFMTAWHNHLSTLESKMLNNHMMNYMSMSIYA